MGLKADGHLVFSLREILRYFIDDVEELAGSVLMELAGGDDDFIHQDVKLTVSRLAAPVSAV